MPVIPRRTVARNEDAIAYRVYSEGAPCTIRRDRGDGYAGPIRILLGIAYEARSRVRILEHRDTPGLGDKIESHAATGLFQFEGRSIGDPPVDGWASGETEAVRSIVRRIGHRGRCSGNTKLDILRRQSRGDLLRARHGGGSEQSFVERLQAVGGQSDRTTPGACPLLAVTQLRQRPGTGHRHPFVLTARTFWSPQPGAG